MKLAYLQAGIGLRQVPPALQPRPSPCAKRTIETAARVTGDIDVLINNAGGVVVGGLVKGRRFF
ncbi:MAG: hypothetical protein WCH35_03540 [Comamonadaceae bacterium]